MSSSRSPTRYVAVVVLAVVIVTATILGWRAQRATADRADGLRLAGEGKGVEAEPRLVAAWDRDGADAEVAAALARLKLASADPATALPYLTRWCELRSDDPKPFQLRMDLRHRIARGRWAAADRLKDMDDAAGDGQHVLEIDPSNDAVRREVAWLLIQVGRFADAEAACRTVLAATPLDGWMTYLLARAFHGQGKRSDAERVLDLVIKAQPKFADGLLLRAKLHLELDRPAEAVPLLRQALALDTGSRRECLYQLGLALAATGDQAEADKVMAEVNLLSLKGSVAADAAPETEAMRVQIAEAMLGMGRLNEAKEQLDKVVAETPDFGPAHRVLAIYYDRANQPDRAAEHRRLAAGKDLR
jgi:predicted Zn-dependent protease